MKMIVAILNDKDSEPVSQALISKNFRVTRIASSGGFLKRGSTTLMIGVEAEKVDEAIQLIRENCPAPDESALKKASLFVLNVADFEQL
jgi:uncharacterized protein YaaQ